MIKPKIEIVYQDNDLIAVAKPHGMLVHKSPIAADATEYALQLTRDLVGQHLHPLHRIDRKTYGVLLFATTRAVAASMREIWSDRGVDKAYYAIVRGWVPDDRTIDHPVYNDKRQPKDAISTMQVVHHYEIDLPHGPHNTSRYTLVRLSPLTGRYHQLRQHMNHLRHPILGDRPHGCNKQNRLWLNSYGVQHMMLWAERLSFIHPVTSNAVVIAAPPSVQWTMVLDILGHPIDVSTSQTGTLG